MGIQCVIEISDGTKLRLALDCLHIQAANRNTLLHCEGELLDTTVVGCSVMAGLGDGRREGGGGGGGYVQVEVTHGHMTSRTHTYTNKHASSPETAVVLDYRIRN